MSVRTQAYRKSRGMALGAALFCLAVAATASDYPPPPGTYQSEPLELAPAAVADQADRPIPQGSSRMLPLPGVGDGADGSSYAAERLFGAAPGVPDAPPPQPLFAPITGEAPPAEAALPQGPAAQPPAVSPQVAPDRRARTPAAPAYPARPQYPQPPTGYPARMPQPGYGGFPGGYRAAYPPTGFADGGYPAGSPRPGQYPRMGPAPPDYAGNVADPTGYARGPFVPQMPPATEAAGYPDRPAAPADDALFRPPEPVPYQ